jgi:hypothetical protein
MGEFSDAGSLGGGGGGGGGPVDMGMPEADQMAPVTNGVGSMSLDNGGGGGGGGMSVEAASLVGQCSLTLSNPR